MNEFVGKLIEKTGEIAKIEASELSRMQYGETLVRGYSKGIERTIRIVKDLAAEYNDGWIPCSERLPEDNTIVAVCLGNGCVTAGFNSENGGMIGFYGMYASNDVIAWQPLPNPYREKGDA